MSSDSLAGLVDAGAVAAMDSFLVIRHGRVVAEAYYAPFRLGQKHHVYSTTKAVTGTLAGIAFKEGALGPLNQSIIDLFPERKVANLDANKKAITLDNLLDLTSGIDWSEEKAGGQPDNALQMVRSTDWVGFVLDRPMAQRPGTAFNYDSGTWHLLSAILEKKTGVSTVDYARQKLFTPLGITDVAWRQDPQGITMGSYGLFMRPRDMAKIGYLYLHGGEWAGQQLLPAPWVDKVFHPLVDMGYGTTPGFRYANGWWAIPDKRAYMAVGYKRQVIILLPDVDMVVVTTGRDLYWFPKLIDRLTAAVKSDSSLPVDVAANARLASRINDVATEKASEVRLAPPFAHTVSGKTYSFGKNAFSLKSFKLDLESPNPTFDAFFDPNGIGLSEDTRFSGPRITGPIGLDGFFRIGDMPAGELRATKGRWLTETSFQIVSRLLLEGVVTTLNLSFQGDRVDVEIEDNRGVKARFQGESGE